MARQAKGITLPIVYKADLGGLKEAEGALSGFGSKLGGIAAGLAAAFSVAAITNFAKEAVLAAEGVATANARIGQIAKSTALFGSETDAVTKRMIAFAEAQEMRLAVDAEVIKGVQAQLLTFKALGATATEAGGTFDRVTEAAFNMAAAGFGSAESNAIALGKAMEDPVRGLTALRKSGTTFTEEQQAMIKSMAEAGDTAGAQEIILAELESQYGGVAEATANASDRMALAMDNIKESAGQALLPIFAELVEGLLPVVDLIGEQLGAALTELSPVLLQIAGQIPGLVEAFIPLIPALGQIAAVFFELVAAVLPVFVELINQLLPVIMELAPVIADVFVTALQMLAPILLQLALALMPIIEALLPVLLDIMVALAPVFLELAEALLPLIMELLPPLVSLIEFLIPILTTTAEIIGVILVTAIELFVGAIAWLTEKWGEFGVFFEELWTNIKAVFVGIVNGIITVFEGMINTVIRGLNWMIDKINSIQVKIPNFEIFGRLAGKSFGFNFAKFAEVALPRLALAEGGIVTAPVNALIGEAGPEAVIPLDRFDDMGTTINVTVNAGVGDPVRIGEEVIRAITRFEKTSGPVFARV